MKKNKKLLIIIGFISLFVFCTLLLRGSNHLFYGNLFQVIGFNNSSDVVRAPSLTDSLKVFESINIDVSGEHVLYHGSSSSLSSNTICSDSDGGRSYYTKGEVSGRKNDGQNYFFSDYCKNGNELVEYSCVGNAYHEGVYRCGFGSECFNDSCRLKYLNTYSSLSDVKSYLLNLAIVDKNTLLINSGYQLVSDILRAGYSGYDSNIIKEKFLNAQFSQYKISESQKEYIIRVVHSLWLEEGRVVPWSLKDFTKDEIETLFWINELNPGINHPKTSLSEKPIANNSTQRRYFKHDPVDYMSLDSSYQLFLLSKKYKKSDIKNTAESLLRWQKKNFFHAYYNYGWDKYDDKVKNQKYLDQSGRPYPNSLARLFDERITGCHLNAFLYANLLRSLNIPAVNIASSSGHAYIYLPTIDRYVHGDHIADFVTVLAKDMFLTAAQAENNIDHEDNAGFDYSAVITKKYKTYHFSNPELLRSKGQPYGNKKLYIYKDYISYPASASDWKLIEDEVKEYNIKYDPVKEEIISDYLPIKTLEDLTK